MANLRDIKGKIRAVGKTRQVTRAMEAVSASKMRKSQEKALVARPYALSAFRILRGLSRSVENKNYHFMKENSVDKVLIIVVTSDRGLAGSLNSSVLKKTMAFIKENNLKKDSVGIISIGKKGHEFFSKRGYTMVQYFDEFGDVPKLSSVRDIALHSSKLFERKDYSHVFIAYSNFISTFSQESKLHKVLPLSFEDVDEVIKGIVPVKGKYSEVFKYNDEKENSSFVYTYEPSHEEILRSLIIDLVTTLIYHAHLEAKASEFSARMVAMRSASDKALEMANALSLSYNKARQSNITREVSEIVGGVEALSV